MYFEIPDGVAPVLAAVFLGGVAHGATGFGFSLMATPIAAATLGMGTAVPMMNLLSIILTSMNLYANRKGLLWNEAIRLMLASLPGLACGVLLLRMGDPELVKRLLGIVLLGYAIYALVREIRTRGVAMPPVPQPRPVLNALAGFSAGFFGGSCAADGPPVVVYGNLQHWPKERFRAVLQAFFLFNGIMLTTINFFAGYLNERIVMLVVCVLPGLFVGSLIGNLISGRLEPNRFRQCVLGMVILMALNLLLR
jgi:uncharacterized membrane protein YfcA